MKVLHVQRCKGIGGSERHLLSLLPALRQRGFDARLCLLAMPGAEQMEAAAQEVDIPTISVPSTRHTSLSTAYNLRRVVTRLRPDIVHSHLFHAHVYAELARGRSPSVAGVHGDPRTANLAARLAQTIALRRAASVVCVSPFLARRIREDRLAGADRTVVITNGIDLGLWAPPSREAILSARANLGLTTDETAVGITGRVVPGKGHALLVEAVALASTPRNPLRLVVVGAGPELDAVRSRSAELGLSVIFTGFVDDVRHVLPALDVVACPTEFSLSEGLSLSAIEAMAHAIPVIVSPAGALPETVGFGSAGMVVELSVEAWTSALQQLASSDDGRRAIGLAGRRRVESNHALDAMVDRIVELYESVAVTGYGSPAARRGTG